jgi:predicted DCC family thiol-disulfide oxidoreductase YuxK
VPDQDRVLVLYDADCGICTRTARFLTRLDRRRRLELVPAQAGSDMPGAPPLEARLPALHVRHPEGRLGLGRRRRRQHGEGAATPPTLAITAGIPGGRRALEHAYAAVAANRHRISRAVGMPACATRAQRSYPSVNNSSMWLYATVKPDASSEAFSGASSAGLSTG